MNTRNPKHYEEQLLQSLHVESYPDNNCYIVGKNDMSVTVIAAYPTRSALVKTYILYHKVEDIASSLGLSMQAYCTRGLPRVVLYRKGWYISIERRDETLWIKADRQYYGPCGEHINKTFFQGQVTFNTIHSTIKSLLENDKH